MTWRGPRQQGTSAQRGYGSEHTKARAKAAAKHKATDPCARCGKPLGPMGPGLHYDHNATRTGYLGFSHARCNVRAGAKVGRARQGRRTKTTPIRW